MLFNVSDYATAIKYNYYGFDFFTTSASGTAGSAITWFTKMSLTGFGTSDNTKTELFLNSVSGTNDGSLISFGTNSVKRAQIGINQTVTAGGYFGSAGGLAIRSDYGTYFYNASSLFHAFIGSIPGYNIYGIMTDTPTGDTLGSGWQIRHLGNIQSYIGTEAFCRQTGTSMDLMLRAASGLGISFCVNNDGATKALTLDSSGNATFTGTLQVNNEVKGAAGFYALRGSETGTSGTWYTMCSASSLGNGTFYISCTTNAANGHGAEGVWQYQNGTANQLRAMTNSAATTFEVQSSGGNLQIRQTSGVTRAIQWAILFVPTD